MVEKFKTSLALVKIAIKYIKQDGELLIYSFLSLLSTLIILASFLGGGLYFSGVLNTDNYEVVATTNETTGELESTMTFKGEELENTTVTESGDTTNIQANYDDSSYSQEEMTAGESAVVYGLTFAFYFVFSFITFFFNTAIITAVQRRIEGLDNKFGDGIRDAFKHIKQIFIWSMISALVSTILKIIQNKFPEGSFVGNIIVGIIGGMWNILTFFSFPLMIVQGMGPKEAIKESGKLFKKTWGERAMLHVGVGFIFGLAIILVVILAIAIAISGLYITGLIVGLVGIITLGIISSTADTIIKTILLQYANTGTLPGGLESEPAIINLAKVKEL